MCVYASLVTFVSASTKRAESGAAYNTSSVTVKCPVVMYTQCSIYLTQDMIIRYFVNKRIILGIKVSQTGFILLQNSWMKSLVVRYVQVSKIEISP